MSENAKHHATIVLERHYEAAPGRVFAEFANPVVRARWSAPSGDELIYDETAFEVGGWDVFRCGPRGAPRFQGETTFNTLELEEVAGGTKLKLTIQIVSSAGEGMVQRFESGNRSALEGLAKHLADLT